MEAPGKVRGPKSAINITPLVDVVLVLLIIFIVVTPMLTQGADVLLPAADNCESQEDSKKDLIISVQKTGQIWLGTELMTVETLETRLTNTLTAEPFKPILVKGDLAARYGDVVKVMAVCERTGAKNVKLMTDSDSTRQQLQDQLREQGLMQ
jgi:biopolymer transport protein ExbD